MFFFAKSQFPQETIKKGVIKVYADRARAYCDPEFLENKMKNIDVFVDNGYSPEEVKDAMKVKPKNSRNEQEKEKETRGIVVMPNIPNFTEEFNRIAKKHGFRVANKTEQRVKDLISNAKTPRSTCRLWEFGSKLTRHLWNTATALSTAADGRDKIWVASCSLADFF